ncbi:hypothetical protein ACSTHJ_00350, partial [Vibrio parahaemolyticus]
VLADSGLPPARAMVAKRAVLLTFCLVWLLALVALGQEWSFSPGSQVLARYQPVFLSFVLGLVMLGFVVWDVPERIWLQRGVLAIMVMLIL